MKKDIASYINDKRCQHCESSDVEENDISVKRKEAGRILIGMDCEGCGRSYYEVYTLQLS